MATRVCLAGDSRAVTERHCAIDRPLGEQDARGTGLKRGLWLIAAVLLAYGSAVPGDFVWLDHLEIEQAGYRVESGDDLSKLFRYSLDRYLIRDRVQAAEMRGGYFRPVYALSISADWLAFGDRPAFFHAENLLWHAVVVLLLYALGLRLFAALRRGDTIAFAAALLFAVHPLATQSVTWVSGRKDAMCAAFVAAALLAFLRALEQEQWRRFAVWSSLSAVATLFASLSKELGLLVPVLASALVWIASRSGVGIGARFGARRSAQALFAVWLAAGLSLGYRVLAVGIADLNAARPADGLLANVATSATVLWRYIAAVLLPAPTRLSDAWPIAHTPGVFEITAIAGILALVGVCAVTVARRGPSAFPLVWCAVLAAPASGLVPLRHFHAERYLYPAYWGLLAVVLILLLHHRLLDRLLPAIARRPDAKRWGSAALMVIVVATAALTAVSNPVWWSDETLFRDAVERDPHHVEGRLGLALHALRAGELEEAVSHSRRAIEEGNDRNHTAYWVPFVAHLNLAGALEGLKRPSEAYTAYGDSLLYRPDDSRVLCRAGHLALSLSRPAQALEHLERAAQLEAAGLVSIGFECALTRALARGAVGEWEVASRQFAALLAKRPRNLPARLGALRAQLEVNQIDQAKLALASIQKRASERADLLALEAWILFREHDAEAATKTWQRGHQLDASEPLLWEVVARFGLDFRAPVPSPPEPAVAGAGNG